MLNYPMTLDWRWVEKIVFGFSNLVRSCAVYSAVPGRICLTKTSFECRNRADLDQGTSPWFSLEYGRKCWDWPYVKS